MPTLTFSRAILACPFSPTKSDSSTATLPNSFWAEMQNVAGSNSPGVANAVSGFPIAVRAGTYAGTICSV